MKNNCKNLGLVTKKFNEFFLVDYQNKENFKKSKRFLCKQIKENKKFIKIKILNEK